MGTVHAKAAEETKSKRVNYEKFEAKTQDIDVEGVSARVDKVHIDGLGRTKNDFVTDCFDELFKATDFQDILLKAHRARLKLDQLGCFKNIAIFIDTSKGVGATPNGLEVTYHVQEFKRVTGGVSTHVGHNEGALLVGLRAPNILGRGERIQFEYTHGSKKTCNLGLGFIKPLRGKSQPVLSAFVFQNSNEFESSGYKELGRGLLLDLAFNSHSLIKHNLQWEGVIREDSVLGKGSSFEVRENAGATLKSCLRHILTMDFRDDIIFPTCGSAFQMTSEFSGLGGEIGYIKNDAYFQLNTTIVEDVVLQGTLSGGYLTGISNDMKITLSDLFYLGGPLSLRGFQMRGAGPHSDGDATGAKHYWSAGLHLYAPLPFRPGKGGLGELFRTHFFVNTGNIANFKLNDEPIFDVLSRNMRVAYGLGLALRLGNMARVEINYCFPHLFADGDITNPGIQFGIGVQFI